MKLHNDDLDKTIDVPDNADLRVYERQGWTPAAESEVAAEDTEPGPLLPDATAEGDTAPDDGEAPDGAGDKPKRSTRN